MNFFTRKLLNVHHIEQKLYAQGPGIRYTIWVQGCSIHCQKCYNTQTWDFNNGVAYDTQDLAEDILNTQGIDGITITGGEPLDQFDATLDLCEKLFGKICIFLTTGYDTLKPEYFRILEVLDIICLGPFEFLKICKDGWRGSSNQRVKFLTNIGKKQEKMPLILKEFIIKPNGNSIKTGFHI
jgi:anaerobic ribonucleoside-triphosphate reductase activating protein